MSNIIGETSGTISTGTGPGTAAPPKEATAATFMADVVEASSKVPVLVDFWADWCAPCRMIAPTIDQLAADYEGRVKVGKVDVDTNEALATQFNISSIPTLLLFKDGKVVEKFVGLTSKEQLEQAIDRLAA